MWMASVGLRQALPSVAGVDLAARADLSMVRLKTGKGEDAIDGLKAEGWRGRAGLEASRRLALGEGASLAPFVEAAGRRDTGDVLSGTGLELAGGVRYAAERLHVEARGRWLAAYSEGGMRERGLSVTARLAPGAHGRGLSLALTPRWGATTGDAQALWGEDLPHPGASPPGAGLDAALGYGFAAFGGGFTASPHAGVGVSATAREYRLGWKVTPLCPGASALSFDLEAARRDRYGADPQHRAGFEVTARW